MLFVFVLAVYFLCVLSVLLVFAFSLLCGYTLVVFPVFLGYGFAAAPGSSNALWKLVRE